MAEAVQGWSSPSPNLCSTGFFIGMANKCKQQSFLFISPCRRARGSRATGWGSAEPPAVRGRLQKLFTAIGGIFKGN